MGTDDDPAAYVGLRLDDAIARAEAAGWTVRVLRPDSAMTMDYRERRLNLVIPADGEAGDGSGEAVVLRASRG